jgi:hypothetical protein
MAVTLDLQKMPIADKLRLMEDLWHNLTTEDPEIASPHWHADVLAERTRMSSSGEEQPLDWETAKRQLRSELQ